MYEGYFRRVLRLLVQRRQTRGSGVKLQTAIFKGHSLLSVGEEAVMQTTKEARKPPVPSGPEINSSLQRRGVLG